MTKKWVAFASVLLLSGTVAVAGEWTDKMKVVDTDGSGTVSRSEWNANAGKLQLGTAQPEFSAMDQDNNNSVDTAEWDQT
jgi:EF hand domain-containing protein